MYQTSNRRDLPEEWIQWTIYFSMCHDRLNFSPPMFAVNAFRTPLCLLEFGKQSAVPYVAEPTNPQCSPESRVKTQPTWTNTSPSFPSAGAPAGPQRGTLSQHGDHSGYQGMHMEKLGREAELVRREILKIKVAYYKGEGSPWLTYIPTAIQLAIFFALVVTLYWALSDWTVHYTNVQGKILLLHYTFSKIYTE